jgi:hypothetical protein
MICVPGIGKAQVAFEKEAAGGVWRLSVEAGKTSFIGTFGHYVGPEIAREWRKWLNGGGRSAPATSVPATAPKKRPSIFRIILPTGKLPGDMRYAYGGSTGFYSSVSFAPDALKLPNGLAPRFSLSLIYDSNKLAANAPSGIGILIDPTRVSARAEFRALSWEASVPFYTTGLGRNTFSLYAGAGWLWAESKTIGTANSAFLRLRIPERSLISSPVFSLAGEFKPVLGKDGSSLSILNNTALTARIFSFRSQGMWTAGITAGMVWRL